MSVPELLSAYGVIDGTGGSLPDGLEISDFCGIWCSEGTVPWDSGLTLELQIGDFDETHWSVDLNVALVSAAPSMRIASVEKSVQIEKENPIILSFDNDEWYNKGTLSIELRDDGYIGFSCEIEEYSSDSMWDLGTQYTVLYPYTDDAADVVETDDTATYNPIDRWDNVDHDYYNEKNGVYIAIEWVDSCLYNISSDYFYAESVWIDYYQDEVTLFFDSDDGTSITFTFGETDGGKYFELYTDAPDLTFLNGGYSTTYGGLSDDGGTEGDVYVNDAISDVYGIYSREDGSSYLSFGCYTGEGGGFYIEYYGSDATVTNQIFSVSTPYINSENNGDSFHSVKTSSPLALSQWGLSL